MEALGNVVPDPGLSVVDRVHGNIQMLAKQMQKEAEDDGFHNSEDHRKMRLTWVGPEIGSFCYSLHRPYLFSGHFCFPFCFPFSLSRSRRRTRIRTFTLTCAYLFVINHNMQPYTIPIKGPNRRKVTGVSIGDMHSDRPSLLSVSRQGSDVGSVASGSSSISTSAVKRPSLQGSTSTRSGSQPSLLATPSGIYSHHAPCVLHAQPTYHPPVPFLGATAAPLVPLLPWNLACSCFPPPTPHRVIIQLQLCAYVVWLGFKGQLQVRSFRRHAVSPCAQRL